MAMSESPKFLSAQDRLPDDLRPIYRDLVKQYAFFTKTRYGRGYVAYEVLADLVLAGWRQSEPEHTDSKL
jgi:hypothetical protein